MTASLALELRLPLFHERLESLVDVFRRGDEPERHGFHLERDIDWRIAAPVQQDLRETNRDRRLFASFSANARTSAANASFGTVFVTRPIVAASSAVSREPRNTSSFAFACPRTRTSR